MDQQSVVRHRFQQIYADKALLTGPIGGITVGGGRRRKRGGGCEGGRMKDPNRVSAANANPWVQFLRSWSSANNMTYAQALKSPEAKAAYRSR